MDTVEKYNQLYDIYGAFLTSNQKNIFKLYFEENLNLQEIADEKGTSKSFIGKTINECKEKLDDMDNKLHLSKLRDTLDDDNINNIKNIIQEIMNSWNN